MANRISFILSSILVFGIGELVCGMPAGATTSSASPSPTAAVASSTVTPTSPPAQGSSDSLTKVIILVVVFCVLPLFGLWFCCRRRGICCFSRKEKRLPYNAAYPNQVAGGVFLVPVNQFVPHDDPKMGYAVRVDTPANAREVATPAPPMYQEMMIVPPPRAATPAGKMVEKNGGWKGLFKV